MSEINLSINRNISRSFILTLIVFVSYFFISGDTFTQLSRPYAPPGQTLYVFSKAFALLAYILMWWQIFLSIVNIINNKLHIVTGTCLFIMVIIHMVLFISAVSIRHGELQLGVLIPNFSISYYATGISLGVLAICMITVATISGVLRNKLGNLWKAGHILVYIAFIFATVHGFMIGSDFNSKLFSYVVYGAILSLIVAFLIKKYTRIIKPY